MPEIPGHSGDVLFTNFQSQCKSFTIDYTTDLDDITAFDGAVAGVKEYLPILRDWTATLEMNFDTGNSAVVGTSATLTLTVGGGSKYTGTAYLVTMGVGQTVDGVVTQTGTFQGTDALVLGAV